MQVTAVVALTTEGGIGLPVVEAYELLLELSTVRSKYRGSIFAGSTSDNAATKSKVNGLKYYKSVL